MKTFFVKINVGSNTKRAREITKKVRVALKNYKLEVKLTSIEPKEDLIRKQFYAQIFMNANNRWGEEAKRVLKRIIAERFYNPNNLNNSMTFLDLKDLEKLKFEIRKDVNF